MESKTGVLLVNLGTPFSPKPSDVHRYLVEFLTDARVMDLPWLWRQILVRGIIIPSRYRQSAQSYAHIWTKQGSPLLLHSLKVKESLQEQLGVAFQVEIAMRYQQPSIEVGIQHLLQHPLKGLIIAPLFPQYASATTGSVHQKVMHILSRYEIIPEVKFLQQFASFPPFIEAICQVARSLPLDSYDHLLFSYHGLPQKQVKKGDKTGTCLRQPNCCDDPHPEKARCYVAQCFVTTRGIIEGLQVPKERYSVCFQSRLGKDPWLQPYTSDMISELARQGKKRVLVFCPSFVCDCLETLYEIGVEYANEFKHAGGEVLDLVPGLNNHPAWIQALKQWILSPLVSCPCP
jgi:ferrochelatase